MKIIDTIQGSDAWHEERWRCITGTKMKSSIGAKFTKKDGWKLGDKKIQRTLLLELVSEFQSVLEIDDFSNESMDRGHGLELPSITRAEKKLDVIFETCGMLQRTKP